MKLININKGQIIINPIQEIIFNDSRLNWKAKGLLIYLYSLSSASNFDLKLLIEKTREAFKIGAKPDSKEGIYKTINELISSEYLVKSQININGNFGNIEYTLKEIKNNSPLTGKAEAVKTQNGNYSFYEPQTIEKTPLTGLAYTVDPKTVINHFSYDLNILYLYIYLYNYINIKIFNNITLPFLGLNNRLDQEIPLTGKAEAVNKKDLDSVSAKVFDFMKLVKFRFKDEFTPAWYEKVLIDFIIKFGNDDLLFQAIEVTKADLGFDKELNKFPPGQNAAGYFYKLIMSETFVYSPNIITPEQVEKEKQEKEKLKPIAKALNLNISNYSSMESEILSIILSRVWEAKTGFLKTAENNILSEIEMNKNMNKNVDSFLIQKINDKHNRNAEKSEESFKIMICKLYNIISINELKSLLKQALINNEKSPRFKKYLVNGIDKSLSSVLIQFDKYFDSSFDVPAYLEKEERIKAEAKEIQRNKRLERIVN